MAFKKETFDCSNCDNPVVIAIQEEAEVNFCPICGTALTSDDLSEDD